MPASNSHITGVDYFMAGLADHGSKPRSAKQIADYWQVDWETKRKIQTCTTWLRNKGFIEHQGYARYVLTEKGKPKAQAAIDKISRLEQPQDQIIEETMSDVRVVTDPLPLPPLAVSELPPLDWQREYIKLALLAAGQKGTP